MGKQWTPKVKLILRIQLYFSKENKLGRVAPLTLKIKSNTKSQKTNSIHLNSKDCPVSKASVEIMLDRVCNGKTSDFPFSK